MKVLVLGNGLLGSEISKQTQWDIISRKKDKIEALDFDAWSHKLIPYNIITNCIAYTDSYSKDKENHYKINYEFVSKLVSFCNKNDKKLVQISTEFVYALNTSLPTEEDIPQPNNSWYSYTKLLADEYIQLKSNKYLICRELHKPNPFPYEKVWDVQTSGDTVDKIAKLIIELINKNASGIYNVGTGGKNLKELAPDSVLVPPPIYVPKDTRMNLDKLNKFLND
jgi:dTDP-4-dehydrorhamnose reductase